MTSMWSGASSESSTASRLDREQNALRLDLIFPVLYATAFAVSLLLPWRAWQETSGIWLLVPVVIYLLADWTENLVHLRLLRLYRDVGPQAVESGWVQIASRATTTKLLFFLGSQFLVLVMIIVYLWNK